MIRYYLAIVDDDFKITEQVQKYFLEKNITLVKHFKSLGVLKLSAEYDLLEAELQCIKHLELDSLVYTTDTSEE